MSLLICSEEDDTANELIKTMNVILYICHDNYNCVSLKQGWG